MKPLLPKVWLLKHSFLVQTTKQPGTIKLKSNLPQTAKKKLPKP